MILGKEKRGLSPVIATVLLIAIALLLAIIIFLWARGFISEKIDKFGEPIENSCVNVDFEADASVDDGTLIVDVINKGNVPLYGVEVKAVERGSVKSTGIATQSVSVGETASISVISSAKEGDKIIVTPMLLGTSGLVNKPYTCDDEFGVSVTVS